VLEEFDAALQKRRMPAAARFARPFWTVVCMTSQFPRFIPQVKFRFFN